MGESGADRVRGGGAVMPGDERATAGMACSGPQLGRLVKAQDYLMWREQLRRYRGGWLTVAGGSAGSGDGSAGAGAAGDSAHAAFPFMPLRRKSPVGP